MMLSEFNDATGAGLAPDQYELIERVYIYHPIFENLEEGVLPCEIKTPKDFAYLLYKIGGLQIFRDLDSVAGTMDALVSRGSACGNDAVKECTRDQINALYMLYE